MQNSIILAWSSNQPWRKFASISTIRFSFFLIACFSSISAAEAEQAFNDKMMPKSKVWFLMGAVGFNSGFRGRHFIPYSSNQQGVSTSYSPNLDSFIFQEMTLDLSIFPLSFSSFFVRDLGVSIGYGLFTSKLYVSPTDCPSLAPSVSCSSKDGRFIFASFKVNRNIGLTYRWSVFRDITAKGLPFEFDILTSMGWHYSKAYADPEMNQIYPSFNADQVMNSWYSSAVFTFTPREFPYFLLGVGAEYRGKMIDVGEAGLYIRSNDVLFKVFIAGIY